MILKIILSAYALTLWNIVVPTETTAVSTFYCDETTQKQVIHQRRSPISLKGTKIFQDEVSSFETNQHKNPNS